MEQLAREFESAIATTYEEGTKRGYYPTYFMQMLDQLGGVGTARRLLATRGAQPGLYTLWELGILCSSVEAFVIQERFRPLFTDEEREEARRRLEELGCFKGSPPDR